MITIEAAIKIALTNSVKRPQVPGNGEVRPMNFACNADTGPANDEECNSVAGGHYPPDLRKFWQLTRTAKFFEDITYKDWGVEIFSPERVVQATHALNDDRPQDFVPGDLVVGRLIGDSDLLILRADTNAAGYGTIILAGPIDPRADWDTIANSLQDFLSRYIESRGDMFWIQKT